MRLLLLGFVTAFVSISPALGETYIIQVRGINPAMPAKMVTCNENNRPCFLTLSSAEEDAGSINVAADFTGDAARFEFMQQNALLPISNDGGTVLTIPLESMEVVSLLDPQTVQDQSLVQKPVIRNGRVIAKLEVLAFRQKLAD